MANTKTRSSHAAVAAPQGGGPDAAKPAAENRKKTAVARPKADAPASAAAESRSSLSALKRLVTPVQAEQVVVEGGLALAVIGQKNATVSQSSAGAMVAGQQLDSENGGSFLALAGQDLHLTNGGAALIAAGRDAEITNGGAGILFAGRDLTIGSSGDGYVAVAGREVNTEQRRSALVAGNQVHVASSSVGILFALNATIDDGSRVLLDLSPQHVFETVVGLATAPIKWLASLARRS